VRESGRERPDSRAACLLFPIAGDEPAEGPVHAVSALAPIMGCLTRMPEVKNRLGEPGHVAGE